MENDILFVGAPRTFSGTVYVYSGIRSANLFRVSDIFPAIGGDIGSISVLIGGDGFEQGAKVGLVNDGQLIEGNPVVVSDNARFINTTFDVKGRAQEFWDVVVTNPNDSTAILVDGFTVEEGREPQIWIDIIGRNVVRQGTVAASLLIFSNSGNVNWNGHGFLTLMVPRHINSGTIIARPLPISQAFGTPQSAPIELEPFEAIPPISDLRILAHLSLPSLAPSERGAYALTLNPEMAGGDIVLQLSRMHPELIGEATFVLLQTKAYELNIPFPNIDQLLRDALVSSLQEAFDEIIKTFTLNLLLRYFLLKILSLSERR